MKPILLAAVAAFAAVQLLQPTISNAHATGESNLLADPALDPRVRSIFLRSCADCHSNRVRLPWYGRVSPFSWMIARHIEQGRDKLNFSDWPRNSANEKQDIADSVEKGEMPFAPYLLLHRQARISEEDRKAIARWADSHEPSPTSSLAKPSACGELPVRPLRPPQC